MLPTVPKEEIPEYTRDPHDTYLFDLMIRHDLNVMVTGDLHLHQMSGRYGFLVLSPGNSSTSLRFRSG